MLSAQLLSVLLALIVTVLAQNAVTSKLAAESRTESACPKHCLCVSEKLSMKCTHLREGIPQPVAQQASFFSFTNKSATLRVFVIHRAIFERPVLSRENFSHPLYTSIVDLAFTMTNIETIGSRTFENMLYLSRLVFKYNHNLKNIEPEAFFGLNLQRLEFNHSPQLALTRDTVFVETCAKKLVIRKCGLSEFSYDVFHLILKLSRQMSLLDLEGNEITTVDSRFASLFPNITSVNLDDNALLCVEQNYWLYQLFQMTPEKFATVKFNQRVRDLSCKRTTNDDVVFFRRATKEDFNINTGKENTLITNPSNVQPNTFYEVHQSKDGTPAGRSISTFDDPDYEEFTEPLPGETPRNGGGLSSVNRLTTPWQLVSSTVGPYFGAIEGVSDDPFDGEGTTTPLAREVGRPTADAFFYILIIAGSVSFLSIIIGVITSVRRAATWPRNKGVNGGKTKSNGKAKGDAPLPIVMIDKSLQSGQNKRLDEANGERLLSASAEEADCIDSSVCDTGTLNSTKLSKPRCFNIIENSIATGTMTNNLLYSSMDRKSVSPANDNAGLYLDNSRHYHHHHHHHSSTSSSPLLSVSPEGSSHSSTNPSSAILLAPIPPPAKVIRFADMESDECL